MKLALGVEYDGSRYHGWQRQAEQPTVQQALETALSQIADAPVSIVAAGRTDTGVHACGQVIHFWCSKARSPYAWVRGSNTLLPQDIAVLWAEPVDDSFHARFSALGRRYCYVILNRPIRPTYLSERVAWEYRSLDVERMTEAAKPLIGLHDFSAYRASSCQAKSSVRDLHRLDVSRRGEWVIIDVEANSFLHHMVRNLAGVLIAIGAGEAHPEWAEQVLRSRNRICGGVTAPAEGLYFMSANYPDEYNLPSPPCGLPFW